MSSILSNVAVFSLRDNSYTLHKHLYDVVRDDWPGYSDIDRQLLKRYVEQIWNLSLQKSASVDIILINTRIKHYGLPTEHGTE